MMQTSAHSKTSKNTAKSSVSTRKTKADALVAVDTLMKKGDLQFASALLPTAILGAEEAPLQNRAVPVPLSRLIASPRNVRRVNAGGIEELAALIDSQGLLHPLIVTPHYVDDQPTGNMEVVAGGRRLAALQLLAERGSISVDALIECKQIEADNATEIGLAENSARMAMHPADQFDAFLKLVNDGKSVEEIALRFGVTPLTVYRRLRLAAIAPSLIEKFRADELTLDQMIALTVTDDHAAQEAVWENVCTNSPWMKSADSLRRALKQQEVSATNHPMVRFVGLDAYLAAGGHVRRDLFSERDDDGFISDTVLLNRLAAEKLNALAEGYREAGWQWVEVRETFSWQDRQQFASLENHSVPREPTEAEAITIDALEQQIKAAETLLEDENADEESDAYIKAYEDHESATDQLEVLREQLPDFPDEVKAASGVILTISINGSVDVVRALVRIDDDANASCDDGQSSATRSASHVGSSSVPLAKQKPEIGEKLMQKLSSHRTAAMQVLLAENHQVALATVAEAMLDNVKVGYCRNGVMGLRVNSSRFALTGHAADIKTSRAWLEMDAKLQALSDKLDDLEGSTFAWLLTQSIDDLVGIIALCSAVGLNAVTTDCTSQPATELATALHLDMADWWQPTAASYFGDVSKDKILCVVAQTCGVEQVKHLDKMKKGDLVTAAEHKMKDTRWLPVPLR